MDYYSNLLNTFFCEQKKETNKFFPVKICALTTISKDVIYLSHSNSIKKLLNIKEKNFKIVNIKILKVSQYNTLLKVSKQKYICKSCNKSFSHKLKLVSDNCSISNNVKPDFSYLPEKLCFDEFKLTKDADGAMSFIYCDAET